MTNASSPTNTVSEPCRMVSVGSAPKTSFFHEYKTKTDFDSSHCHRVTSRRLSTRGCQYSFTHSARSTSPQSSHMDGHDVPFGSQARPQKKTKKQKDKKQRQKNKENQASHQSGKKGLSSRLEKNDPKKIRQGHRDDAAGCC